MADLRRVALDDVPIDQAHLFWRPSVRIKVFARDRDGNFYIDPDMPDEVARQPAYGGCGVFWTEDHHG